MYFVLVFSMQEIWNDLSQLHVYLLWLILDTTGRFSAGINEGSIENSYFSKATIYLKIYLK